VLDDPVRHGGARLASAALDPPIAYERTFDARYGLRILAAGDGGARGELPVGDDLLGVAGHVHSGVYAAVAESLASLASAVEVMSDGLVVSGLSNTTIVLAEVSSGTLHAEARRLSRGASEWVWEIAIADADGAPCATSTVVIALREPRPAGS
jgi:uncharacterized protein (TIGR00369 family)